MFDSQDGSANGITGPIDFDKKFKTRQNFHMDLIEMEHRGNKHDYRKTAEWNAYSGLILTRTFEELQSQKDAAIQNKVFKVVSRIDMPYLGFADSNDSQPLRGNDRYKGFIRDLMDRIAAEKGFTYTLMVDEKGHFGKHDPHSGKWDGMIGNDC